MSPPTDRRLAYTVALAAMLGLGAAAVAGCSTGRRGDVAPLPLGGRCPPPMAWPSDDQRPLGIRIRNEQSDSVWVFLDYCHGHVRVGDVGPRTTRVFRLRPPLVTFPNGLRFHVFPGGGLDGYFAAAFAADRTRVLELTVPAESPPPCTSRVFVDGELFDGGLRDVGLERIAGMRVQYASSGGIETGRLCPVIHVRTPTAAPVARPSRDR